MSYPRRRSSLATCLLVCPAVPLGGFFGYLLADALIRPGPDMGGVITLVFWMLVLGLLSATALTTSLAVWVVRRSPGASSVVGAHIGIVVTCALLHLATRR